jgi:CRP-like cAMP-binding protein
VDLLSNDIAGFAGTETRTYGAGESLRPLERLKHQHIWIVRGALALEVGGDPGSRAILEVFGPGSSLDPRHWEPGPGPPWSAVALLPTETLELPVELFRQQLSERPALAVALASQRAHQHARSLDRIAALRLRDPYRRVAVALLQLAERLGTPTPSARGSQLELTQQLIAAFADVSRQTTNRQIRRLAAARLVEPERGVVLVHDLAALAKVAATPPTREQA